MFIVFDGIDGAGKSSQITMTQKWLQAEGCKVIRCADPGSTRLGLTLRKMLLKNSDVSICPWSEALLFVAARTQLLHETILPALARGDVVLCDRYIFSTIVYQGHAGGLSSDALWQINSIATERRWPDLTILLDLPAEVARSRWDETPDRMESRGEVYFEKVRQGFRVEAQRWPTGVHQVDANRTADEVQLDIRRLIERLRRGT